MNANEALVTLLDELLTSGHDVPSRVGNTKELRFLSFQVDNPLDRYITAPNRNVSIPAQIAETMWVLAGRNDVKWLSAYLPQAPKFADDGKHWRAGYGPRLRSFDGADQLANVIQALKEDPTTRRAVISLWDPRVDFLASKDIPCNNWLHFLARDGILDLSISTRSNDIMWGWSGINFFEWSVLLEIVASCSGLKVGNLHFNVSSMHLYEHHFEKAKRIVDSYDFSSKSDAAQQLWGGSSLAALKRDVKTFFYVEDQIRKGDLRGIFQYVNDPLLWTWMWAIAYYWGHTEEAERHLAGSSILPALRLSPKRKTDNRDQLVKIMTDLHTEKSAAYGDSWKKRGEIFSILPNIARKVDRILANTETSDETRLDTAMDLVVYLGKYQYWLNSIFGDLDTENAYIRQTVKGQRAQGDLNAAFEKLLKCVEANTGRQEALDTVKAIAVNHLLELWEGPEGRALRNNTKNWNPE